MTRRFSVKIAGKEHVVQIGNGDGNGNGARVVVDGAELSVEAREAEAGMWVLREGDAQTVAFVDGEGAKLTLELRRPGGDPVVLAAEVADARSAQAAALSRQTAGRAAAPATVRSPIPGRVVKLLVRPGDQVTAGQATVVLEAMKMENELRAPRAGTVQEVRCAEGAAVEAGQDLVVIA